MVAINALDNDNFLAFSVPLGIMLFGAAGSVLTGGGLPKWMAWLAILLGITLLHGPVGFFGFCLTGIWIIIASILMYRRAGAAATTA